MKRGAHIWAVVVAFSFGIEMVCGQTTEMNEPEYNGKTLTQWFEDTNRESPVALAEAIQHIGSNAVPFLVAVLREEQMTNSAVNANPDGVWTEQLRRDRAMRALEVLGPEGKAAIPDLVRLATNRARFFDQSRAVSALARMTPYSVSALTNIIFNDTKAETRAIEELYINDTNVSELEGVLLSILHGTNTRSKLVVGAALARFRGHERFNNSLEFIPALTNCLSTNIDADHETLTRNATYALANFGPRASSAIPAMLEAIRDGADDDHSDFNRCEAVGRALAKIDPDQGVQALVAQLQLTNRIARRNAAWALEAVKSKAAPAIPALIKSLDDPDPDVRVNAIVALREIHGEGGIVIPALIRKLNDSNEKVQWVSAIALGRFGPEAKEAVPGIRKVIKTCDEREKQFVVQALLEIDPTAQP